MQTPVHLVRYQDDRLTLCGRQRIRVRVNPVTDPRLTTCPKCLKLVDDDRVTTTSLPVPELRVDSFSPDALLLAYKKSYGLDPQGAVLRGMKDWEETEGIKIGVDYGTLVNMWIPAILAAAKPHDENIAICYLYGLAAAYGYQKETGMPGNAPRGGAPSGRLGWALFRLRLRGIVILVIVLIIVNICSAA